MSVFEKMSIEVRPLAYSNPPACLSVYLVIIDNPFSRPGIYDTQ